MLKKVSRLSSAGLLQLRGVNEAKAHGELHFHAPAWNIDAGQKPVSVEYPDYWYAQGFAVRRSEEHTSELQSLMRISYAVFCLKKKKKTETELTHYHKSDNTNQ